MNAWAIKSLIPFTKERRLWREATEYLQKNVAFLRTFAPSIPDLPRIPRDPRALDAAIAAMIRSLELLRELMDAESQKGATDGGTVRMVGPRRSTKVMGEVEEQVWTTLAADVDGVVQEQEIGKHHRTRHIYFAFCEEAEAWLIEQEAEGWSLRHGPTACATAYFGETDSPSNCWSCEVEKEVLPEEKE